MATWTKFTTMIGETEITLELLERGSETVGWIVRRSCNVWQAFVAPAAPGDVLDLESDGTLVGIFPDDDTARQAVLDDLAITAPTLLRIA